MGSGNLLRSAYRLTNNLLSPVGLRVARARPKLQSHLASISAKPEKPLFVNMGAGRWRHPLWHNLDHPVDGYDKSQGPSDLVHDLMSQAPLPFADSSLRAVYTSHTIEHLNDEAVARLLSEVWRCLVPGGFFRITCPDAALAYDAYLRGDRAFWHPHDRKNSIEQLLISTFATSLSTLMPMADCPKMRDDEVRRIFSDMERDAAFNATCARVPPEAVSRYPQSHDTWFTTGKLTTMLEGAGFAQVWESRYGQSRCPDMRDLGFFDKTRPDISLFVECRK